MSSKLQLEQYSENLGRIFNIEDNRDAKYIITYLLYLVKANNDDERFSKFDDAEIGRYFGNRIICKYYEEITKNVVKNIYLYMSLLSSTTKEVLKEYLINDRLIRFPRIRRTESINKKEYGVDDLIERLLDINENDKVLFCYNRNDELLYKLFGMKNVEKTIFMNLSKREMSIYDAEKYTMIKINAELNEENIDIITNERLLYSVKFNKIYCESENSIMTDIPIEDNIVRECLDINGIAVKLVKDTMLDATDPIYKFSRQNDLEKKDLKAIISLPSIIGCSINRSGANKAIVLYDSSSKRERVMFVNATSEFKTENRTTSFSEENIKRIVNGINKEKENLSTAIPYKRIKGDAIISFSPFTYVKNDLGISNAVELGSVATVLRGNDTIRLRGIMTASNGMRANSEDPQYEYRSISVRDFESEAIDYERFDLVKCNRNLDEYVLKNGDIMLNKNGMKLKVYIFTGSEAHKVIPDGNIIVIKTNREKLNPMFLKVFLESEIGNNVLMNVAQSGTVLRSINISRLIKVMIPLPDIEEQNKFVIEYTSRIEQINKINNEIKDMSNQYFFKKEGKQ